MSTSNDGVSRFLSNTIYGPVEFKGPILVPGGLGAITCTTLTASGAIAGLSVAATNALTGATCAIAGLLSAASIQCASYSSLANRMTLTSGLGLFLAGDLLVQDGANAEAPAALVLADIPFCAMYTITAARAFVLPDTLAGGMPQGVRMSFLVPANVVVTFVSATRAIVNIRNTNGGLIYQELAATNPTPNNVGGDVLYNVSSANDRWVITSFAA